MTDTIAAVASAAGAGGVGIIRLSGPRAIAIAADALGVAEAALDRSVRVGWAKDAAGDRIDQVLAFAMRAPASFTGEDVAELHGHGGSHNLGRLLAAVVERGARLAEPGEFTRRAVLGGKLDLVRAEALLGVIAAGSDRAWRLAQRNLEGRLGDAVIELERRALVVLAEVEGRIDFPEDDLEPASEPGIAAEIAALRDRCATLADGFRRSRAIGQGISVALVGPVNVGKSSLLNALIGSERALVAAEPGTTRDYVEAQTAWHGVAVTVIDTAGSRDTHDAIEARGIALGEQRVASADVVVVVNDGSSPWDDGSKYGRRAIVVRNKADLGGETAGAHATSAVTRLGLESLVLRVLDVAGIGDREGNEDVFVTTERQHAAALAARDAFAAASALAVPELLALELRAAVTALAQLRGVEVGDRVLDEVFARFCIGK